jgi:multidrug efflux system membrane fusion protein
VRVTGTAPYVAVLIPDEAIGTDQTNKYVLTVGEDGTVARKAIVPGPLSNGLRVAREGITGDEWVITKGLHRARPGQKVSPKRETLAVSEASADAAPGKKRE